MCFLPVHCIVIHESSIALQVELAQGEDAQRHERHGED